MERKSKMTEDMISVQKMLKKAKRKQLRKTILVAVIAVAVLLIGSRIVEHRLAVTRADKAVINMDRVVAVSAPGMSVDGKIKAEIDGNKGIVTGSLYKMIDGYYLHWGKMERNMSWLRSGEVTNTAFSMKVVRIPGETYVINPNNNQKVAIFYELDAKEHKILPKTHAIKQLIEVKDAVAEVAITFDKPYTLAEIKQMVPENLLPNFYWVYAPNLQSANGPRGYMPLGVSSKDATNGTIDDKDWKKFYDSAKHLTMNLPIGQNFKSNCKLITDTYKGKSLDEVTFGGVMLTGKTASFASIKDKSWLGASSGGAVVQQSPFIQATK
jgi:hypothetical protein